MWNTDLTKCSICGDPLDVDIRKKYHGHCKECENERIRNKYHSTIDNLPLDSECNSCGIPIDAVTKYKYKGNCKECQNKNQRERYAERRKEGYVKKKKPKEKKQPSLATIKERREKKSDAAFLKYKETHPEAIRRVKPEIIILPKPIPERYCRVCERNKPINEFVNLRRICKLCEETESKKPDIKKIVPIKHIKSKKEPKYIQKVSIKKPISNKRDIFTRQNKIVRHGWDKELEEIKFKIEQFYN